MRVFVRSFGCSSNLSDGEVLAGVLSSAGYEMVNSEETADLIIYNTCAVKGPTENRIINIIKHAPTGKQVIVAGCLPLINFDRLCSEVQFNAMVGPASGERIVSIVNRVANGEVVIDLKDALMAQPRLFLPHIPVNPVVSIISINYGCLGSCAYCCVKHARGNLRSYAVRDIIDRIKHDLDNGAQEFWLTSQDTACYGKDIQSNLASLLKEIVQLEGDFKIRIGMMNPNLVTPILDEIIEVFHSEKLFKFLHLPVQSGDDEILNKMCRFYTTDEFKNIISGFKSAFPQLTLSTDIICGFPGESIKAHQNTLRLLKAVKPDIVNISKFFARPKTAAWDMRNNFLDRDVINSRTSEVASLVKRISLERNEYWINWVGDVFVDEKGKVEGSWIGRNFAYKPVVINSHENLMGQTLTVKIIKAFSTHLIGTSTKL